MSDEQPTKTCSKCQHELPTSFFYRCTANKDGLQRWCKPCIDTATTKSHSNSPLWNMIHRTACRTYRGTTKGKMSYKSYRSRCPDKIRARRAVAHAVAMGSLLNAKSMACHFCGKEAVEYHHHLGYAQEHFLDVVPTCLSCHVHQDGLQMANTQ